ncbi:MAG: DegT/DnrJ/EryC1/StrS family aminotransferase [Myxococcota bacterium]
MAERKKFLRLAGVSLDDRAYRAVKTVLKSGRLIQGEKVAKFENHLARFIGVKEVVAVSSGTAALHLSALALGIGNGDAVIVPAFTFPATANAFEVAGAVTILADVHMANYCLTPISVSGAIKNWRGRERLKAIVLVHEFGYPALVDEIKAIADKYGLLLVEDAACALGSRSDFRHVGSFGAVGCFSFHPRKALTTGEGGAVVTDNSALAEKLRRLRNHGINWEGESGMDFSEAGLNYRMTEFQAALGLAQACGFQKVLKKRRALAELYFEHLGPLEKEGILTLPEDNEGHSWQTFMVTLNDRFDRDAAIRLMRERGVETNLGAQALCSLRYYKTKYLYKESDFPTATRLYRQGLALPLHTRLSKSDVEYIAKSLMGTLNAFRG